MAEPALKLAELEVNDIKSLAGAMAVGLLKTPVIIAEPAVSAAQLTGAVSAVSTQEPIVTAAEANASTQRDILAGMVDTLKGLMTKSAKDSALQVEGNPTQLQILNVPTRSEPSPTQPLTGGPQNFSVTQGDRSGEADGHCDRIPDAKMYKAEHATSPAGPWTQGYDGTKSKFTIGGLPPGQETWFRMAAYVGGVWSDWSDPAKCRIV